MYEGRDERVRLRGVVVSNANGRPIADCGLRIADFGFEWTAELLMFQEKQENSIQQFAYQFSNQQSAIRNPKSVIGFSAHSGIAPDNYQREVINQGEGGGEILHGREHRKQNRLGFVCTLNFSGRHSKL